LLESYDPDEEEYVEEACWDGDEEPNECDKLDALAAVCATAAALELASSSAPQSCSSMVDVDQCTRSVDKPEAIRAVPAVRDSRMSIDNLLNPLPENVATHRDSCSEQGCRDDIEEEEDVKMHKLD
jgi:hypothetical protein